jgi:hypothetical protein
MELASGVLAIAGFALASTSSLLALLLFAAAAVPALAVVLLLFAARQRDRAAERQAAREAEEQLRRLEQIPAGLTGRRYMNWKVEAVGPHASSATIEPPDPDQAAATIRALVGRRQVLRRETTAPVDG